MHEQETKSFRQIPWVYRNRGIVVVAENIF